MTTVASGAATAPAGATTDAGVVRTAWWPHVALAALGGFLVALSLPPWGFWPLAVVGVAVFELALGPEPPRRRRGWAGFAFGAAWLAMAMGWMWFLTPPGYAFAATLFASFHAVAAIAAPTGAWRVLGRPAAHTLVEAVRFVFPFGGVPVASIGISQASGPLLGLARVGGVILITWVVFQLGVVLGAVAGRMLDARRPLLRPLPDLVALAVVAVVVAIAAVAPRGHELDGDALTIAAVQGGGEQGTTALDVPSSVVTRRHLDATRTIAPDPDLDLVVWPENGIDVDDEPFAGSDAERAIAAEAARLGVPVTVGVTVDSEFSQHPTDDAFVNAQVVVTPGGEVTSEYEKVRIVPFGEYVPFRGMLEAIGAPVDQIASDAVSGKGPARIELPDGTELGVLISWEVFFGRRGRAADDGAILLNPTNGASYTGTILQTQQIASSRLRAAETGRWVVQVSPTGFSAFVSPDGEVLERTDVSEQRVIRADVPLRAGTTWYSAFGDVPWWFLLVAALLLAHLVGRGGTAPGLDRAVGDRDLGDRDDATL